MTVTTARRAVVVEAYADYAVEAYNLRKVYRTRKGRHPAVDGLDLRVPLGGVHGFLGPNGSGKTTTIRMLLGLATATGGSMALFGRPAVQQHRAGRGADQAEQHPHVGHAGRVEPVGRLVEHQQLRVLEQGGGHA